MSRFHDDLFKEWVVIFFVTGIPTSSKTLLPICSQSSSCWKFSQVHFLVKSFFILFLLSKLVFIVYETSYGTDEPNDACYPPPSFHNLLIYSPFADYALDHALDHALDLEFDHDLDLDLNFDPDFDHELDLELELDNAHAHDHASRLLNTAII